MKRSIANSPRILDAFLKVHTRLAFVNRTYTRNHDTSGIGSKEVGRRKVALGLLFPDALFRHGEVLQVALYADEVSVFANACHSSAPAAHRIVKDRVAGPGIRLDKISQQRHRLLRRMIVGPAALADPDNIAARQDALRVL